MVKNIFLKTEIFWKIPEIADDHNYGTEHARNLRFVSKMCVFGYFIVFY